MISYKFVRIKFYWDYFIYLIAFSILCALVLGLHVYIYIYMRKSDSLEQNVDAGNSILIL